MTNIQSPFGFRSWSHRDGSPPTAGFDTLYIASSDTNLYFTGDPVASQTTGPYITIPSTAAATVQLAGVFAGCEYYSNQAARMIWSPFFPGTVSGSTADVKAYVITDPEMQFMVQTSTNAVLNSSNVGLNVGFTTNVSSQGSQTTGISAVTLLATSVGTTSSLPFRVTGLYSNWGPPGVNGTDNTNPGNFVIVAPNNWDRKTLVSNV
jgi:hypothetical protein